MNCFKKILYCGQETDVFCDGECSLAIGHCPPRESTSEGDAVWSKDNYKNFPNKWCVRQCDRCKILELEDAKKKYGHTRLLRQPK